MTEFYHLDAAESVFFRSQLEYVYSKTYDIKYADLKHRQFIPQSTEANPGATTVTYEQFEEIGRARIGSNRNDAVPRVDLTGTEFTRPVRPVQASYGWTVKEVKSASMAGRDLNSRRAATCRRAIERGLDEIAAIGAPLYGIASGALNEPNTGINAAAASWTGGATADQILGDIQAMYTDIINDTFEVETPDTLVLPGREWAYIATEPRSTTSDTTILEFVRRSYPTINSIEAWHRLTTAGAGGVRRGWMYPRRDDILTNEIPSDFEQLPVQATGFEYVVNAQAETAGVAVYYPLAMHYVDGI